MEYIHLYNNTSAFNSVYNSSAYTEPWVSLITANEQLNYNKTEYEKLRGTPLTFEVISDGDIIFDRHNTSTSSARTMYYKVNGGEEVSVTVNTATSLTIHVVSGDVVEFYATNAGYADRLTPSNRFSFCGTTCGFNLKGNIMSIINRNSFRTLETISTASTAGRTFPGLFEYCAGLTNADKLVVPIKTLGMGTMTGWFKGCPSLRTSPDLSHIETIGEYAFQDFFNGCGNLLKAPELPWTALTNQCYTSMFGNCTSLTEAPALPAITLAQSCYSSMFYGCTGITKAPDLPAEVLAKYCYQYMFQNCSNLNYVKCLATDISASSSHSSWLSGVAATGTFVKKAGSTWPSGVSGIPDGWTVQEI